MRDTLIHFGDMRKLYDRYEELTGEPVDIEAVKRRHFAGCIGNQFQFGAAIALPGPDTDLMTFMQWTSETNLMATDFLGEYLGVDLPSVEPPPARRTRHDAGLLGRRPADWYEAERELEQFVMADAEMGRHDPELALLFHRRNLRTHMALGPAGSSMTRHYQCQRFDGGPTGVIQL